MLSVEHMFPPLAQGGGEQASCELNKLWNFHRYWLVQYIPGKGGGGGGRAAGLLKKAMDFSQIWFVGGSDLALKKF